MKNFHQILSKLLGNKIVHRKATLKVAKDYKKILKMLKIQCKICCKIQVILTKSNLYKFKQKIF